jgi:hypothetical protein
VDHFLLMQMQLLTRLWVWSKSLLGQLLLVGLVVLVVYLLLKLEFAQHIQIIV